LDFAVAFGNRDVSGEGFVISGSPTKFTLFGFLDSTKIPIVNPKPNGPLGCLSQNFSGWVPLGSVTVSGEKGTWQRAVIEFVSNGAFQTIALGSSCDLSDVPYTPRALNESIDYYFIDDLKFYQASAPKPRLSKIGGNSCEGESTTLRLQSNDYYNGSVFQWYKNNTPLPENNVSITTSSSSYGSGWYKMRVQNDSVCAMSDSIFLEWVPRIVDPYLGRKDTTLCIGETIELKIRAGTNASYLWSTGSIDSAIIVTQTGTYSVRVSNACNTLNALKTIIYKNCPPTVFVPSAFSPNGDGLNDIFRVSFSGTMKSFSLTVYDRFGQRIFHSTDPSKGWDGKVKGKVQNAALFVWRLQYTDGSDKTVLQKGSLTLIK
jgi:gliding motility-associated-like protein